MSNTKKIKKHVTRANRMNIPAIALWGICDNIAKVAGINSDLIDAIHSRGGQRGLDKFCCKMQNWLTNGSYSDDNFKHDILAYAKSVTEDKIENFASIIFFANVFGQELYDEKGFALENNILWQIQNALTDLADEMFEQDDFCKLYSMID